MKGPAKGIIILFVGLSIGAFSAWLYVKSVEKKVMVEKKEERKILFYRHPMKPEVASPTPKKDEMGMDYVPVYEDELAGKEGPGVIRISPEKIQRIGVRSEEAKERSMKRIIRTVGRIEHDEGRVFTITAKIGGWVDKLYVNKTDQMVHPGEPLLELFSPDLISAQEEYLIALKSVERVKDTPYPEVKEGARTLLSASRQKLKYWDISDNQIKRLEEEGVPARTMTIYSPAHGIVTEKAVTEGMNIGPGEMLFKIIDHSSVWVYGEVYEYELPFIKAGQKAKIIPSYTPADIYTATINHIYTHLGGIRHEAEGAMEEESLTAKIRFELPNPQHRLKLGMYVNIELAVDVAKNAVAVPESAVINTGARSVVIVDKGEGRFEPREVQVGGQADGYYQILSGIKAGERVVTSGNFLIDSEASFSAAMEGMKGH